MASPCSYTAEFRNSQRQVSHHEVHTSKIIHYNINAYTDTNEAWLNRKPHVDILGCVGDLQLIDFKCNKKSIITDALNTFTLFFLPFYLFNLVLPNELCCLK